jgi:hypothetical protein
MHNYAITDQELIDNFHTGDADAEYINRIVKDLLKLEMKGSPEFSWSIVIHMPTAIEYPICVKEV